MWLAFALASSASYAIAETLDNFFANKEFKHPFTLVFFSALPNILYIPCLMLFTHPELPPLRTLPLFLLLGFVNVGYLYPYYKGLTSDDTSVAVSFLAIERIMVPVLAFFIVGEVLAPLQYLGIFIVIASVVLLGLRHSRKKFTISKGVWYISLAALFLAGEAILLKLLFLQGVSVSTAVGGEAFVSLLFGVSVLGISAIRRDVVRSFPLFLKLSPVFLIEELFTFLGLFWESEAISRTSVSLAKGVTMASPFFLILYAWIAGGLFPQVFKEDLHRQKVLKKCLLFLVLIAGIILIKE